MKKILLSRTDGIGDVILTLPMVDIIKRSIPDVKIYFLGQTYTQAIIQASNNIDEFIDWNILKNNSNASIITQLKEYNFDAIIHVLPNKQIAYLAAKAKIPIRIGTSHRFYNILYCNKLINLTRRNSDLHEAQLNIMLLKKLNIQYEFSIKQIQNLSKLTATATLPDDLEDLLNTYRNKKIILHPKSKGSAKNWSIHHFAQLAQILAKEHYDVYITGTAEDSESIKSELGSNIPFTISLAGKLTLPQLITFINRCDFLVSSSTGPLHIASNLEINTIGIYPPIKPMDPQRWAPIGSNSKVLCISKECNACRNSTECGCINEILPEDVFELIKNWK